MKSMAWLIIDKRHAIVSMLRGRDDTRLIKGELVSPRAWRSGVYNFGFSSDYGRRNARFVLAIIKYSVAPDLLNTRPLPIQCRIVPLLGTRILVEKKYPRE
ncbi:hypothetical protein COCC4DRAFT_69318 [Bipolaris maydis ATCC 48331]|uniref:Uncharacterized protein n=2 Tax=Cochliobolus heterostrophus TaxID=5016 RepID=M2UCZ4_COCH5|nr:uncharacterized protein COCC4DRAFT_69318 [Bipolaris maydis ATCC 48331]EMD91576.1 hypothetical protein COCHEDRAFT_1136247 [Bipolaris maydis C5]ENI08668.1 hypothetical protein COCC4DRAFT_69318 [Bipolaris maydis ATCC 48331]